MFGKEKWAIGDLLHEINLNDECKLNCIFGWPLRIPVLNDGKSCSLVFTVIIPSTHWKYFWKGRYVFDDKKISMHLHNALSWKKNTKMRWLGPKLNPLEEIFFKYFEAFYMHTHKHFSQWVDLLLTHPEKYFKRLKVHYSFKVRYQTETAHFAFIHFIYAIDRNTH